MTKQLHTLAAEFDPRTILTLAYNEATALAPSVPIAPHLGLVAMEGVQEGSMAFEDVVTFADRLEEPHFALMRQAARDDHEPRHRPIPPDDIFRITAGFDVVSLLTAARELFRQDRRGQSLDVIIKPTGLDDPVIIETKELLSDRDNLQTYIDTLDVAATAMRSPELADDVLNPYKDAITDIENLYDGVIQGNDPVRWQQRVRLTDFQRRTVSTGVKRRILPALLAERGTGDEPGRLFHVPSLKLRILADNLTRYKPVREWFAGRTAE